MDNTNENTNAATAPDPKQSAYDDAQDILRNVSHEWADRLRPCGTGEREIPIGNAIARFDTYLSVTRNMPADERQRLISSLL